MSERIVNKISQFVWSFGERINIYEHHTLRYTDEILNAILSESETKPWRTYVNALENYVDWLYIHSINVAIISLMIAVKMKYNDDEMWHIGLGAFLHDVGKLLIPKSIIQKPKHLSHQEVVFIRRHCELGVSSLDLCCLPKECTDIVLQHHERLDGSGYPRSLIKNEISPNAKIVMIADVVDAITSGRPYRASREMGEAIKILRNDKGRFCGELVTILEKMMKK